MDTRYLDAAVAQVRADGHDIKDEEAARLSPLKDRNINFLGRYQFNIKASGLGQDCTRCGTGTQSGTTKASRPPAEGVSACGYQRRRTAPRPQGTTRQDGSNQSL
ncbi:Tn3 family transposase [Streptomyces sp. NPDC088921]|uniref:Tn3 family transposase n=1 Tax=unclassified Streptomyces TaxID=2593676 RepID=UPI0034345E96